MCVVEAGVVTEFDLMFYVIKCSTFETNSFGITVYNTDSEEG